MRKLNLFAGIIILSAFFGSCNNEEVDREKIVEMTVYPETGYGASVLSDVVTEPMQFSDNDENRKQLLTDIITEGFDFDYFTSLIVYKNGAEYRFLYDIGYKVLEQDWILLVKKE